MASYPHELNVGGGVAGKGDGHPAELERAVRIASQ